MNVDDDDEKGGGRNVGRKAQSFSILLLMFMGDA